MMDAGTGKLYPVFDEAEAKKLGLVPVKRKLTDKERGDMQIRLYSPCSCGSGEKFKFCCFKNDRGVAK
jgi:hypothetical protein